jgi:hypothetical protein
MVHLQSYRIDLTAGSFQRVVQVSGGRELSPVFQEGDEADAFFHSNSSSPVMRA